MIVYVAGCRTLHHELALALEGEGAVLFVMDSRALFCNNSAVAHEFDGEPTDIIDDADTPALLRCGTYGGILQRKRLCGGDIFHRPRYAGDVGEIVAVGRGYLHAGNPEFVVVLRLSCAYPHHRHEGEEHDP